jgi:hypothetical protein
MPKKVAGANAGGGAAAQAPEAFVAALLKSRKLDIVARGALTTVSEPVTIMYRMAGSKWTRRIEWALCRCFFDSDARPIPTYEKPACLYVGQFNLTDDGRATDGHACVLQLYDDDSSGKFTWAFYDPNGTRLPSRGGVRYEAIQDALVQLYPGISHDTIKQHAAMPFTLGVQGILFGQGNGGFCALLSLTRCKELVLSNDRFGAAEAILKKAAWQARMVFKAYKDVREDKELKFQFLDFDKNPANAGATWDEGTLRKWAEIETNQKLAKEKGFEIRKGSADEDIRNAVEAVNPPAALTAYQFCEQVSQFSTIDTYTATRSFGISHSEEKARQYVATYIQTIWDLRKALFNLLENTGEGDTPERTRGPASGVADLAVEAADPEKYLDERLFDGMEVKSFITSAASCDDMSVLETKLANHFTLLKHGDRCLVRSPWFRKGGDVPAATVGLAGNEAAIKDIVDRAERDDAFAQSLANFDEDFAREHELVLRDLAGGVEKKP